MFSTLNPELLIISLVVLVYSAILHEIAHGYVADRLGDPTARLLGRLTLNPIPHIDPLMTIAVPLILLFTSPIIFGGAKPVPVDPFNLRDGRKDMALVALAGPATNILLAVLGAVLAHIIGYDRSALFFGTDLLPRILGMIVSINISLAVFNLLPIPPLDGSKIFSLILPDREANTYLSLGSYGMVLLFILLLIPIGPFSLQNFISSIYVAFLNLLGF